MHPKKAIHHNCHHSGLQSFEWRPPTCGWVSLRRHCKVKPYTHTPVLACARTHACAGARTQKLAHA
eukprot:12462905-Alexandrium_andersonii.AAC.1